MEDIEGTKLPKSHATPQKYAKTAKQFANSRRRQPNWHLWRAATTSAERREFTLPI
jgi:hypothetical protein